jgi:hypothetical protein
MKQILYDWLEIQPSKPIDIEQLAVDLSELSYAHATAVQVLMVHHSMENGGQAAVPYNGTMLTKDTGVRYGNIHDIPQSLIKIVAAYIELARKLNS